jgi:hypothetical protein
MHGALGIRSVDPVGLLMRARVDYSRVPPRTRPKCPRTPEPPPQTKERQAPRPPPSHVDTGSYRQNRGSEGHHEDNRRESGARASNFWAAAPPFSASHRIVRWRVSPTGEVPPDGKRPAESNKAPPEAVEDPGGMIIGGEFRGAGRTVAGIATARIAHNSTLARFGAAKALRHPRDAIAPQNQFWTPRARDGRN